MSEPFLSDEQIGEWTSRHDATIYRIDSSKAENMIPTAQVTAYLRQVRDAARGHLDRMAAALDLATAQGIEQQARIADLEAQLAEARAGRWEPVDNSRVIDSTRTWQSSRTWLEVDEDDHGTYVEAVEKSIGSVGAAQIAVWLPADVRLCRLVPGTPAKEDGRE